MPGSEGIMRIHLAMLWAGVLCCGALMAAAPPTASRAPAATKVGSSTNGSGYMVLMDPHQPQRFWYNEHVGYHGDTSDDGRYWCYGWSVTQEARLLDSGMSLVVNQAAASYVTVRGEDGRVMTFEI